MPLDFLTDAQVAGYGRFDGVPSRADLERFFVLDDVDRKLIGHRRGEHNRLGLMLQATTVRFIGRFLEDPLDVPWPVAEYVAAQLGIAEVSCVKRYTDRPMTAYEHVWQIRDAYGFRVFEDAEANAQLRQFLDGREWTHVEGPGALFDHGVGWLRRHRVLLPGITVLTRLVRTVREAAAQRMHTSLAAAATAVDPMLPGRLRASLAVPEGFRFSEMESWRRAPTRVSGPGLVKALDRAADLEGLGVRAADCSMVPANRITALARHGLASKATALQELAEPRRTATLLAMTRHLDAVAIDDALDLFALLMATRLINPARTASATERLASLPRLERASRLLAVAHRELFQALDTAAQAGTGLDAPAIWAVLEQVGTREALARAAAVVEELVPEDDGTAESAMRVVLGERYRTVRPFLALLSGCGSLAAATGGGKVLAAVRGLPDLAVRKVRPELCAGRDPHRRQRCAHHRPGAGTAGPVVGWWAVGLGGWAAVRGPGAHPERRALPEVLRLQTRFDLAQCRQRPGIGDRCADRAGHPPRQPVHPRCAAQP